MRPMRPNPLMPILVASIDLLIRMRLKKNDHNQCNKKERRIIHLNNFSLDINPDDRFGGKHFPTLVCCFLRLHTDTNPKNGERQGVVLCNNGSKFRASISPQKW